MRAQDPAKNSDRAAPGVRPRAIVPAVPRIASGPAAQMLALQRTIGNAAAARLVDAARHTDGAQCGHQEPPVQRSAVHEALRGPGQPMAAPLRAEMESRLGADFSDVRLHTDAVARRSASGIGARAYTSGSRIVVGEGGADRHTLAHELTHVMQQRQGPVAGTDHGGGVALSDPSDRFERAAEENASRVMSGPVPQTAPQTPVPAEPAARPVAGSAAPSVQRQLSYGSWSRKYVKDGGFMSLLEAADPGGRARGIEAPFASLAEQVEAAGRQVHFREEKPPRGRAAFLVEAGEGVLKIDPPSDTASAKELRAFATTLAHELQHAVDFTQKRFPTDREADYPGDDDTKRKTGMISAELRAFGVEAAAAAKLALGDHYEEKEKPFSTLVSGLGSSSISPEQQTLVQEFQQIASFEAARRDPLLALHRFGAAQSQILDRLSAYLLQYGMMSDSGPDKALAWLEQNPKAVQRGLVEGAKLFLARRPQLRAAAQAAPGGA
ncbi:DUF4157 domain-containing protein [Streptomyces sp. NPDC006296]|uniref:eCIS core domain-containing protein n=1 Tax=Streptomyces sp. NPDC006296 TaxID=3156746 RepID=UPI0033ABF56D